MNLGRIFAHAIVRRVAFVLVALAFAWVGIGKAHAQTSDQPQAQSACMTELNRASGVCSGEGKIPADWKCDHIAVSKYYYLSGKCNYTNGSSFWNYPGNYYAYNVSCPVGTEAHSGQCRAVCVAPTVRQPDGSCLDPEQRCRDKNEGKPPESSQTMIGSQCIDGCMYGPKGDGGNSNGIQWGGMGYSGVTCTTPTPNPVDPNDNTPKCTAAGGGMTMCVKPDGRHCYSGDIQTSREICWQPGETGTKTDGPTAQTRGPGTTPAPAPTPPPGDTLNPGAGPATTNTTKNGGGNITNTTNNYTTNFGGNAGPKNDGTPKGGENPDDDEDKGTASGGEGCEAPPVCGGDPVGCATLQQVWRNRCAEGKNKITGGGECDANGNPLFTCAGDQVMCKQAMIAAEVHCRSKKADGNGDGLADVLNVTGDGKGDMGEGDGEVETHTLGFGMLDEGGFLGAAACPVLGEVSFGIFGTFDLDAQEWICDFTTMVKWVFLLLGAFIAFQIISGRGMD